MTSHFGWLIDQGPGQPVTLELVKTMIDADYSERQAMRASALLPSVPPPSSNRPSLTPVGTHPPVYAHLPFEITTKAKEIFWRFEVWPYGLQVKDWSMLKGGSITRCCVGRASLRNHGFPAVAEGDSIEPPVSGEKPAGNESDAPTGSRGHSVPQSRLETCRMTNCLASSHGTGRLGFWTLPGACRNS